TIVTITDTNGDTLCSASAGTCQFKGSRKSTPFAAQRAAEDAASKALKFGLREIEVRVKGPGSGIREIRQEFLYLNSLGA
ncbi:MAG: 30S ribosomal protein S11, partial [Cytophagia bacterium]|nr:30S ribosomal protein S11 [Cytophagia bacterium]